MTKETLCISMRGDIKDRLFRIAKRKRITVSSFCRSAILQALHAEDFIARGSHTCFVGVPAFFRKMQSEISRRKRTRMSYVSLGRELAPRIPYLVEGRSPAERDSKLNELKIILRDGTNRDLVAWLKDEFPTCLSLVPDRSRTKFAKGVRQCADLSA